jgi:hypothetical protein
MFQYILLHALITNFILLEYIFHITLVIFYIMLVYFLKRKYFPFRFDCNEI